MTLLEQLTALTGFSVPLKELLRDIILAQCRGCTGAPDVAIWEDAAARALVTPVAAGALGVQLSDETVWIAVSTTMGDWHLYAPSMTAGGQPILVNTAGWTGIFGYGQSNSVGADSVPVAHLTPVYQHQTFATGPNAPTGSALLTASPLYERVAGSQGETACSSMAAGITETLVAGGAADRVIFAATGGVGGYGIASLAPGTPTYLRLVSYHFAAAALAQTAGQTYTSSAVWWIQGETDAYGTMSQSSYHVLLTNLAQELHADLPGSVLLTAQTAAYNATGPGPALAQLQADSHPWVHFVTPMYFLELAPASNIHLSADSQQEMGYRLSRAWTDLLAGNPVQRLRLLNATQEGDIRIVAHFSAPAAPLAWDTTRVPLATDYGFRVTDGLGIVPILSVALVDMSVVIITQRTISGTAVLRYALDYNTTPWVSGACGNLADSTTEAVWIDGVQRTLKHWCPAFSAPAFVLHNPGFPSGIAGMETGAWEHWDLQVDATSLTGLVYARPLTPVATVNWNANAVVCPAGLGGYINGLTAPFVDRLNYTIAIVFKRPADVPGDYVMIGGSAQVVAEDGAGLLTFGGSPTQITVVQPGSSFGRPWADAGIAVGDWCFAVFTDNAGKGGGMIGGGSHLETASVRTPSARNISVGNAYVPYSNADNTLQIAEVIIFDSYLDPTQLQSLYLRSKSRMAARGLSI